MTVTSTGFAIACAVRPGHDKENDAMAPAISPLAPARFPDMPSVAGVKLATAAAGIRYGGRTDVLLGLFEQGTTVAGGFTGSKCPSAPVGWCRAHLKAGAPDALVGRP